MHRRESRIIPPSQSNIAGDSVEESDTNVAEGERPRDSARNRLGYF
jgi:hypothetical protein